MEEPVFKGFKSWCYDAHLVRWLNNIKRCYLPITTEGPFAGRLEFE